MADQRRAMCHCCRLLLPGKDLRATGSVAHDDDPDAERGFYARVANARRLDLKQKRALVAVREEGHSNL